jgi:hypothetical protein
MVPTGIFLRALYRVCARGRTLKNNFKISLKKLSTQKDRQMDSMAATRQVLDESAQAMGEAFWFHAGADAFALWSAKSGTDRWSWPCPLLPSDLVQVMAIIECARWPRLNCSVSSTDVRYAIDALVADVMVRMQAASEAAELAAAGMPEACRSTLERLEADRGGAMWQVSRPIAQIIHGLRDALDASQRQCAALQGRQAASEQASVGDAKPAASTGLYAGLRRATPPAPKPETIGEAAGRHLAGGLRPVPGSPLDVAVSLDVAKSGLPLSILSTPDVIAAVRKFAPPMELAADFAALDREPAAPAIGLDRAASDQIISCKDGATAA